MTSSERYDDVPIRRLTPAIRRAAAQRGQIAWYGTLLVEHRASPAFILRALTEIADELALEEWTGR
jgi:hypothetical protein